MMDKMTDRTKDRERFIEPILNKAVPFFVHLASIKLLNEHLMHPSSRVDFDGKKSQRSGGSVSDLSSQRSGSCSVSNYYRRPASPQRSAYAMSSYQYNLPSLSGAGTVARANLRIERELARVIEAYVRVSRDYKWNGKVIALVLNLIQLDYPEELMHPQLFERINESSRMQSGLAALDSATDVAEQQHKSVLLMSKYSNQ